MNKYVPCLHCRDSIEIHHISLHQRQCYLNPVNLEKICNYLVQGIVDNKLLKRANFYRWAQQNSILTSISITNRLKAKNWYHALFQMLIYGYLCGFVDYEYAEVLLYIISDGSMWMDSENLKHYYVESLKKEYKNHGIDFHDLYSNHYMLLMLVLERTNRDLELNDGDLDENKERVDLSDAVLFLQDFAPELLKARIELGSVSPGVLQILSEQPRSDFS